MNYTLLTIECSLAKVNSLCKDVASHKDCYIEAHSTFGKIGVYTLKCNTFPNLCRSVIESLLQIEWYREVRIVEDFIFGGR